MREFEGLGTGDTGIGGPRGGGVVVGGVIENKLVFLNDLSRFDTYSISWSSLSGKLLSTSSSLSRIVFI
jgi:hypothetical protein